MKNVIAIIQAHGGLDALKKDAISIKPPSAGLMRLCIEYIGTGLHRGTAHISVAHYYEQNGDLMADPDITIEIPDGEGWDDSKRWEPTSTKMDGLGIYKEANTPAIVKDLKSFLKTWDRNIGEQGFVEAFKSQKNA